MKTTVKTVATVGAVGLVLLLNTAAPAQERPQANRLGALQTKPDIDRFVTFPFPTELVSASTGQRIAWVLDDKGVRNVWAAEGPAWTPKQLTTFTDDDGQAITQLAFAPGANLESAKLGVLVASGVAALLAYALGRIVLPANRTVAAELTPAQAEASTEA